MTLQKASVDLSISQLQSCKYPYAFFNGINFDLSSMHQFIKMVFASENKTEEEIEREFIIFLDYFEKKKSSTIIGAEYNLPQSEVISILSKYKKKLDESVQSLLYLRENLLPRSPSHEDMVSLEMCMSMVKVISPRDMDMHILEIDALTASTFKKAGISNLRQLETYLDKGHNVFIMRGIGYSIVRKLISTGNKYMSDNLKCLLDEQCRDYRRRSGMNVL